MSEKRGDPIPGSRYIRDFCSLCKQPMRVFELKDGATCRECTGRINPNASDANRSQGQRYGMGRTR